MIKIKMTKIKMIIFMLPPLIYSVYAQKHNTNTSTSASTSASANIINPYYYDIPYIYYCRFCNDKHCMHMYCDPRRSVMDDDW